MSSPTNSPNVENGFLNREVASTIDGIFQLTADELICWVEEPSLGGPFGPYYTTAQVEGFRVTVGMNEGMSEFTVITADENGKSSRKGRSH